MSDSGAAGAFLLLLVVAGLLLWGVCSVLTGLGVNHQIAKGACMILYALAILGCTHAVGDYLVRRKIE